MSVIKNLGKWQNYVHYLLLTGGVFITHKLSEITGLEANVINGGVFAWIILFLFYALGLLIFDTIIHWIFSVLPKPYKWVD